MRLEECIEEFSKEETLDGDECWRCPKCKDFRAATKRIELWKVPPVLVVHLKRFQTNEMGVPSSFKVVIRPRHSLDAHAVHQ